MGNLIKSKTFKEYGLATHYIIKLFSNYVVYLGRAEWIRIRWKLRVEYKLLLEANN